MNYIRPGTPSQRMMFALRSNPGTDENVVQFCGRKHDDLLAQLKARLAALRRFIDDGMDLKVLQGLNERGVDLLIEFSDKSIAGISLKSPFDLTQADVVGKVKAQITDSFSYPGLEQYALLLAPCPSDRGVVDRVAYLQAFVGQSSDVRLTTVDVEAFAGFLFGSHRKSDDLDKDWRDLRSVAVEESPSESVVDDRIRFRYLLCRSTEELERLLRDGRRDFFPLTGPHGVVPTPLHNFFLGNPRLFDRTESITRTVAPSWEEVPDSDLIVVPDNRERASGRAGLGMGYLVELEPSLDEPLVKQLVDSDPLTRFLLARDWRIEDLVRLTVSDHPCGSAGVEITAEGRTAEFVVLEVAAIDGSVGDLALRLSETDENDDEQVRWFEHPPGTLSDGECLLVPMHVGLAPFDPPVGEELKRRSEVFGETTIGNMRSGEAPASFEVRVEVAVPFLKAIDVFGPAVGVGSIRFRGRSGFREEMPVRTLDRSRLLYVSSHLAVGSCPWLLLRATDGTWRLWGTILNTCLHKRGVQVVQLPAWWDGAVRIEERETEISVLHGVWLDGGSGQFPPMTTRPVVLHHGDVWEADSGSGPPAELWIDGYYTDCTRADLIGSHGAGSRSA